MNIKKYAPYISLLVIVIYWIYQLLTIKTEVVLPGSFAELAIRTLISKCIQLGIIVMLLYIEQDWNGMGFAAKNYGKQFMMGLAMGLTMFLLFNVALGNYFGEYLSQTYRFFKHFYFFQRAKEYFYLVNYRHFWRRCGQN